MTILARTTGDVSSLATAMQDQILRLDSEIAPNELNTMEKEIVDALGPIRIIGIMMMVFGGVALTLSAVGVYGVLAQAVAQRTREFGIRLALGAHPGDVLRLVLRQALVLTAIGLGVALPISFLLSRAMETLLLGVVALQWTVLAGFTIVLLVVAVAAGYVPARRAMRVDPLVALRHE
jgi:putative ABC transport system permease protein